MSVFPLYAAVLVASAAVVALIGEALDRTGARALRVGAVAWLALHVAAGVAGLSWLPLTDVLVLGTGAALGTLIGRSMGSAGALVTLAVTASVVDIVSFSGGPTRWLLDAEGGAREALRYLAVAIPVEGGVVPVVGIGDLLLLTAFYVSLRRLGGRAAVTFSVLCACLLVALAVGVWRGGAFGIPFMTVGVVALAAVLSRSEPTP